MATLATIQKIHSWEVREGKLMNSDDHISSAMFQPGTRRPVLFAILNGHLTHRSSDAGHAIRSRQFTGA